MSQVTTTSSTHIDTPSRLPGYMRMTAVTSNPEAKPDPRLAELREVIDRTLGSVFYGPLLRSARNSSLKGTFGHGGRGEEIFQNQLDQVLAERAGRSTAADVGEALFNRYAGAVKARGITEVHDAN